MMMIIWFVVALIMMGTDKRRLSQPGRTSRQLNDTLLPKTAKLHNSQSQTKSHRNSEAHSQRSRIEMLFKSNAVIEIHGKDAICLDHDDHSLSKINWD
jgi:hypothetical protein